MKLFQSIFLFIALSSFVSAGELPAGINYGDSNDAVTKKLGQSKLVKSTVPKHLLGRIGLNGSYTTINELEGLKFSLYFGWNDSSGLKEINYRSDAMAPHSYDGLLKEKWDYAYHLISAIYGKAANVGDYPLRSDVTPDLIHFSHEWKTSSGYIYLGVGQQDNNYSLNITFSQIMLKRD